MSPRRFSREEAESKIGGRVRAAADFADIPKGTTGRIMEMDEIEKGGFELIVEWDLLVGGKLQHDWFTKEGYEHSLIELHRGTSSDSGEGSIEGWSPGLEVSVLLR